MFRNQTATAELLGKRDVAIGEKIGVYRDWPVSKCCTPPYVPAWVDAMVKRQG